MQHRYVFDPSTGQPLVQYDGADTAHRKFLSSDERGSIIARTDAGGALLGINTYDEYGKPGASNTGRFQDTGQKWLSELGAYDYKARVYLPHLGVFAQTDPIGQQGSPNLYAYVGGDPINWTDPFGLDKAIVCIGAECPGNGLDPNQPPPIIITGNPMACINRGVVCGGVGPDGQVIDIVNGQPITITGRRRGRPSTPQPKPKPNPLPLPPVSITVPLPPARPAGPLPPRECSPALGSGVEICNRPMTYEEQCQGDAQVSRVTTYGGAIAIGTRNPYATAVGAVLGVIGISAQLDSDLNGCSR